MNRSYSTCMTTGYVVHRIDSRLEIIPEVRRQVPPAFQSLRWQFLEPFPINPIFLELKRTGETNSRTVGGCDYLDCASACFAAALAKLVRDSDCTRTSTTYCRILVQY